MNSTYVSSVLNVQKKVWDAAQKLSYQPHSIAQALSTRRTHVLGLVLLSPIQLIHPLSSIRTFSPSEGSIRLMYFSPIL